MIEVKPLFELKANVDPPQIIAIAKRGRRKSDVFLDVYEIL